MGVRWRACVAGGVLLGACFSGGGCTSTGVPRTVETARALRAHVDTGDFASARALMSDSPRRWFEEERGDGAPWRVAAGVPQGPWAAWDEEFGRETEELGWEGDAQSATLTFRETNDYFRMLGRGWVTNQAVYLFDENGKIRGVVIRGVGERPPGRTDEFRAWARANEPAEFAYLHTDDGEIDPTGDRPQRYRALLERWRARAGVARP